MSLQLLIGNQKQPFDSLPWALYAGWETSSSSHPATPNIVRAVYMETFFAVISTHQRCQLVPDIPIWLVDSWNRKLLVVQDDLFLRAYKRLDRKSYLSHFEGPPQDLHFGPSYILATSPDIQGPA